MHDTSNGSHTTSNLEMESMVNKEACIFVSPGMFSDSCFRLLSGKGIICPEL